MGLLDKLIKMVEPKQRCCHCGRGFKRQEDYKPGDALRVVYKCQGCEALICEVCRPIVGGRCKQCGGGEFTAMQLPL